MCTAEFGRTTEKFRSDFALGLEPGKGSLDRRIKPLPSQTHKLYRRVPWRSTWRDDDAFSARHRIIEFRAPTSFTVVDVAVAAAAVDKKLNGYVLNLGLET